jgi:hypothetical protein
MRLTPYSYMEWHGVCAGVAAGAGANGGSGADGATGTPGLYLEEIEGIILPSSVVLSAYALTDHVELRWICPIGWIPTAYFLESSVDGLNFTQIKEFPLDLAIVGSFSFQDTSAHWGSHFYRLQFLDRGADAQFSNIVKVEVSQRSLVVHPNPTTGLLYLKNYFGFTKGSYSIMNVMGIEVMSGELITDHVDLSSLPDGFYFVQLRFKGTTINHKVLKKD